MVYDAIIIGAGLAGCSSAIHLARRGHRVLLLEKKEYPVHKLCGEFLSVEVQALFARLGVLEQVHAAGTRRITQTLVTAPGGRAFRASLSGTALGLSRYKLDSLLCEEARRLGVDVHTREAVHSISGSLSNQFIIETDHDAYRARVVVGAYGKRSTLDRKLDRPFLREQSRFVAFKAHFEGVDLGPTIELHAFLGGYCGLSHVEGGLVNACWISDEQALKKAGGSPEGMIATCFQTNEVLSQRFTSLRRVSDQFSAISQISFALKSKFVSEICMVGDTAGMIAPLCGDGMAMALRSAELAAPLVSAYLNDELRARNLKRLYGRTWDREFRTRMLLGRVAHHGFSVPVLARTAVLAFNKLPALGQWIIRSTRGAPEAYDPSFERVMLDMLDAPR